MSHTLPGDAIQRAVYAALTADSALIEIWAGPVRVYDDVPPDPPEGHDPCDPAYCRFPYLTIGDDDDNAEANTLADLTETFVTVHIWSRAVGRIEAKRIAKAVGDALDGKLAVAGRRVIVHQLRGATYARDPDGETTHGVVTLRYVTSPTA